MGGGGPPRPLAPTSSPTFSNKGANKGKYDKVKGGENGKGFGVGKDPKACSAIKKENKCGKVASCKWEDGKCSGKKGGGLGVDYLEASASENVEDPMKIQPNSAAAIPQVASVTKVSAAVLAAFFMMWFGN